MKTITTLTIIALACSGNALAAEDICKTYETKATEIMRARQSGVPLSETIERYQADPLAKTLRAMTLKAYGHTIGSDAVLQKEYVADFANDVALACYSSQKP
jgi:hypothetical protein